jgi:hypothetical protein
MKGLAALLFSFAAVSAGSAERVGCHSEPVPVVVLVQSGFWLENNGALMLEHAPQLVIYDDGRVIFRDLSDRRHFLYRTVVLQPPALKSILEHIASLGDFNDAKPHYNLAPNVTDLPTTLLYLHFEKTRLSTLAYGLFTSSTPIPAVAFIQSEDRADTLPRRLAALHHYLTALQFVSSVEWVPERVEVRMWPSQRVSEEPIHWPPNWPGLDSPEAQRRDEDSYSIYLPGKLLGEFEQFVGTRKPDGAVEIGGRKWGLSYRCAFPSETTWYKAFDVNGSDGR